MLERSRHSYHSFFRENADTIPVFYHPEWLDSLCGAEAWLPLVWKDKDGKIVGLCPLQAKKRYSLPYFTQPLYSPALGFYFSRPVPFEDLLRSLRNTFPFALYTLFRLEFTTSEPVKIPKNVILEKRHTFALNTQKGKDFLFENLHATTRRLLKKHEGKAQVRRVHADSLNDHSIFDVFLQKYLHNARQLNFYRPSMEGQLKGVWSQRSSRGTLLFTIEVKNEFLGGLLTVCDENRLYCLASYSENQHTLPLSRLLLWEAIQASEEMGLKFDFGGGNNPTIGQFFQSFGAQKNEYHRCAICGNRILKILLRNQF